MDSSCRVFSGGGLLGTDSGEGNQELVIDGSCIIEESADDTLNACDTNCVERWQSVLTWCVLLFGTVDNFAMSVRRELRRRRWFVAFTKKKVADVVIHGQAACAVAMASSVVPVEVDSSKLFPLPIPSHFIMLVEDSKELISMLLSHILGAKVIDDEEKLHRAPNVAPEARRGGRLMVSYSVEALAKKVVGEAARLWEPIGTADDGEVYPALVDEG